MTATLFSGGLGRATRVTLLGALVGLVAGCGQPGDEQQATTVEKKAPPLPDNPPTLPTADEKTETAASDDGEGIPLPPPPDAVVKAKQEGANKQEAAAKIELKPIDLENYKKFIADQKGKIVAIDYWATWCTSCREKFPKFVKASKKYSDKGVLFISTAFDEEEKTEEAVSFLTEQGAEFTNFRMTTDQLEVEDSLFKTEGVPHYFVYDNEGNVALETHEVDDVLKKLETLVK